MLWGITGCSGTGSSTVAAVWKEMGAEVCSLDKTGHRYLNKLHVKKALESQLGISGFSEMSSGQIRNILREKAFTSPDLLAGINRILHPGLSRWVAYSAESLKNKSGIFVLDAALIFELGLEQFFDRIVTVTDEFDRVAKRLAARDGISIDTVTGRWKNQISLKEKSFRSHFEVRNSGTEVELKMKAEQFYKGVIHRMEEPGGTQN